MSNGNYQLTGELNAMFKRLESDQRMIEALKDHWEKLQAAQKKKL